LDCLIWVERVHQYPAVNDFWVSPLRKCIIKVGMKSAESEATQEMAAMDYPLLFSEGSPVTHLQLARGLFQMSHYSTTCRLTIQLDKTCQTWCQLWGFIAGVIDPLMRFGILCLNSISKTWKLM
jgi:hypothetical protein